MLTRYLMQTQEPVKIHSKHKVQLYDLSNTTSETNFN